MITKCFLETPICLLIEGWKTIPHLSHNNTLIGYWIVILTKKNKYCNSKKFYFFFCFARMFRLAMNRVSTFIHNVGDIKLQGVVKIGRKEQIFSHPWIISIGAVPFVMIITVFHMKSKYPSNRPFYNCIAICWISYTELQFDGRQN